jgi:hypothetical protein
MRIAAPIAALLLLSLPTAEGRAQSAAGPPPLCSVSAEGDYARTPANPARVGGSPLYGAARQRRYLETLRGPAGETVTFTRLPAVDSPDGESLIDRYEVRYAGLETPAILHLDWYHYTELLAPQGFTCGQAFNLGIPPPDPFMAAEQLERLAIADAGDPQAAIAPIELGGSGPTSGGVAFDHYRLVARAARTARQAGAPLVSGSLPAEITKPHSVVVAFPQTCESRTVSAADVKLEDPRGRQAAADAVQTRAEAIARLLPGVDVPAGSVAAVFGIDGPRGGFTVKATYPDACSGATEERSLTIETTGARLLESPMPTRPPGDAAIGRWIAVQAIVDQMGRFREATALGGAPDLSRAAVEAVSSWRADPPRVNGAPLASPVVLQVTFRAAP